MELKSIVPVQPCVTDDPDVPVVVLCDADDGVMQEGMDRLYVLKALGSFRAGERPLRRSAALQGNAEQDGAPPPEIREGVAGQKGVKDRDGHTLDGIGNRDRRSIRQGTARINLEEGEYSPSVYSPWDYRISKSFFVAT